MFTFVDDRVTHVTKDSSFACCVMKIKYKKIKHVLLHINTRVPIMSLLLTAVCIRALTVPTLFSKNIPA